MDKPQLHLGSIANLRPTVNFANHLIATPSQEWGPRTIPDSQLLYIISGKALFQLGNQSFEAQTGECVFYGIRSPHFIRSSQSEPVHFFSIHFSWDHSSLEPIHPYPEIRNYPMEALRHLPFTYWLNVDDFGDVAIPHLFFLFHK